MDSKENELYLKKPLSILQWERQGKPKMWIKKYNKDGITIYQDMGYGDIMLITPQGTSTGKDMVVMGNTVCFGPYYEGTGIIIFTPYIGLQNSII